MALIFDIKRYAINDGPGIRTTLFMKGCPLHCVWCHNPESWSPRQQVLYKKSKCIGCQSCVEVCPQQVLRLTPNGIVMGSGCTLCTLCTEECPTTALELCGREWTMEDLMAEVEKERDIMTDSGGGVTLCGGEPLMHPEATLALLEELGRRGFHRTVDTTLYAAEEVVHQVADNCELLLVDLKLMDSEKHRRFTGVPNELILDNIRLLATLDKDFFVRIPLIEGVNADDENIEATARFLDTLPWKRRTVNLLPYHDVGKDKHRRMWSTYNPQNFPMSAPSEETQQRCQSQLESHGLHVVIGG
ncbi:MAG: glycyl-radical enzyme activating protein [Prevotella sp.]|nr:glycyl-radical enzyme activating protein [Prevotella sp.]